MGSGSLKCYGECMLTSQELIGRKVVCKTIVLKRKIPVILSGKVLDSNGNVISDAMIDVKKLDYNYTPCKITNLGYTMSNEDGAYCMRLQKKYGVDYKLCIYPPLIRD
jgi:hypothetical protein